MFASGIFVLDKWIMQAMNTDISPLFIETISVLLSCNASGSISALTLPVNSLFAANRLDEACRLLFELENDNLAVAKAFFAETGRSAKIQEHLERSEPAYVEFLNLLNMNLLRPTKFLEIVSVFPGSVKATWNLLTRVAGKCTMVTLAPSLKVFSTVLSGHQIKELEVSYLISKLDALQADLLCERLSQDPELMNAICHFALVLLSRPKLDAFGGKLLKALIPKTKDTDAFILGALAKSTFLAEDIRTDSNFVTFANSIAERFEALSSSELALIANQDDLELWSNFVLLNHQGSFTETGLSGMLVILRLICSHVAMNPDKHLPSTLLLFASIISSPAMGQTCIQYLCFYHIIDDICRNLLRSSNKQLLPVFLQCQIFTETFMDAGHFRNLIECLLISPGDKSVWKALQILGAKEANKIPLTLYFPFEEFDSQECEELATLLAILVSSKVDYLDVTSKSANLTLVQCAWNIVASKPPSNDSLRNALVTLSLLMVPVFDVHADLQEIFVHLIKEFKPHLTDIMASSDVCAHELALAILDILS
jgi:hypothetical protein